MIKTKKRYELFEASWLMMRQNPGGTSPYLQGFLLGFAGTINILEAIDPAAKSAELKVKIGSEETQARTVFFKTEEGANPAALTPTAAAEALNAAGFEGCVFSFDPETNRLKLEPEDPSVKWVQIYGALAGALRFGGCRSGEGFGCYLLASFDGDLKSASETEEWSEEKKIENESPLGAPVRYTVQGRRKGTQLTLTDRADSPEAMQMLNGGRLVLEGEGIQGMYEPPPADGGDPRKVDVFTYSKVFGKNDNSPGDEKSVRERMYIGGTGKAAKTGGGETFYDSEYALSFGSYTGDDGQEHASPRTTDYSLGQWEAMNLCGVIEADWENA